MHLLSLCCSLASPRGVLVTPRSPLLLLSNHRTGTDMGTSYFLWRLAGLGIASELLLTGRALGAERAYQVGSGPFTGGGCLDGWADAAARLPPGRLPTKRPDFPCSACLHLSFSAAGPGERARGRRCRPGGRRAPPCRQHARLLPRRPAGAGVVCPCNRLCVLLAACCVGPNCCSSRPPSEASAPLCCLSNTTHRHS